MPVLAKPATAPKPKAAATKPRAAFDGMIKEAICALKEMTGSSTVAIDKYMEDKHGASLPANFKKMLSYQFRGFVAKGKLVKVNASYKLSDAAKKASHAAAAKSAAPKPATKDAAKPKKTTAAPAKPKKSTAGSKRKEPEKKKVVAKQKKSPDAKAKPKTVKSPASTVMPTSSRIGGSGGGMLHRGAELGNRGAQRAPRSLCVLL